MANYFDSFCHPDELSLDERRNRLAQWVLTGSDDPVLPEPLNWHRELHGRVCKALETYGELVKKTAEAAEGE